MRANDEANRLTISQTLSYLTVVSNSPYSEPDDPANCRRSIATQLSGHVIVGLRNNVRIDRVRLWRDQLGKWEGRVDWTHRALTAVKTAAGSTYNHLAQHRLLNAVVAGRGAELSDSFGWMGETFELDEAAPAAEMALVLAQAISPLQPRRVLQDSLERVSVFVQGRAVRRSIRSLAGLINQERDLSGRATTWFVAGASGCVRVLRLGRRTEPMIGEVVAVGHLTPLRLSPVRGKFGLWQVFREAAAGTERLVNAPISLIADWFRRA